MMSAAIVEKKPHVFRILTLVIEMMGSCEAGVSRSIRKVFQLLLKDAFAACSGYNGPRHTILIRDLAFIPHVIQTDLPWRRIRLDFVRMALNIDIPSWERCLVASHSLDRKSSRLEEVWKTLLNYRINIQQIVLTRLRVLFSWNLGSWHTPKQPRRDLKMRKCKTLLAKGLFASTRPSGPLAKRKS